MSEQEVQTRRMNRTLTQKYDMGALRALQTLEADCTQKLVGIMGLEDEDDLNVEIDLLRVYNLAAESRPGALQEMFAAVTQDTAALRQFILEEFARIEAMPSK